MNRKLKLGWLVIVLITTVIVGCAPQINYLGRSYAPTTEVEIFFEEADISREYEVMGVMKNEAAGLSDNGIGAIQEAMLNKAKEVGADAVFFLGNYDEKVISDHSRVVVEENGASSESYQSTTKVVEAKLLKYK